MVNTPDMQVFRPELLPRRGEYIAWGTTLLAFAGWAILLASGMRLLILIPILAIFLLLCALLISLSNWVDRQTFLRLEPDGVHFENGLRRVDLHWHQIQQVQVLPSYWGEKVSVIGQGSHFNFHTLGEVTVRGETKGRVGFAEGEKILQHILKHSQLKVVDNTGPGYYYARQ